MSVPKSTPTRLIPSRQLIAGSLVNDMNDANYSFTSLTATGVAQGDAAAIDFANVEVKAGSANNAGVRLPVAYPGADINILNNSANSTIVYANGSDVIQNGATGYAAAAAGVTMLTAVSASFVCIKPGFWQVTKFGGP